MNEPLLPEPVWSEPPQTLFRWLAPHPEWRSAAQRDSPDDWDEMVGSALYEQAGPAVLFDPLLPRDGRDAFLAWLDRHLGEKDVRILTTIRWHGRDREELAARYRRPGAPAWNAVPSGVEPKPLRGAGETLYWLPGPSALVCGDRLLGDGQGGVRVCPESWLRRVAVDRAGLARLMRPLLELPVERLLVSHGEPVLHDGRAALARALQEAEG